MARTGLFSYRIVVKDDERAFLMRDGRFEKLLGPGNSPPSIRSPSSRPRW